MIEFQIGDTVTLDRYNHVDDCHTVKVTGYGELMSDDRVVYKMNVNGTVIQSTGMSIKESILYKPVPIEDRHDKRVVIKTK